MKIELWQVPLLVIAVLAAADTAARIIVKRWRLTTQRRKQGKTIGLGLLAAMMLALLWRAWSLIGTSAMANIAAVVSTFVECGALWLTYQAYREAIAAQADKKDPETRRQAQEEKQAEA